MSRTVCDASACGSDLFARRGVVDVTPNIGIKQTAAEPELVSDKTPVHVKLNQSRFIRFPCRVSRIALGNTPCDFTSTKPGEGGLKGVSVGRAPMVVWCGETVRSFQVIVEP